MYNFENSSNTGTASKTLKRRFWYWKHLLIEQESEKLLEDLQNKYPSHDTVPLNMYFAFLKWRKFFFRCLSTIPVRAAYID
jgi:hypothetical protein